PHRDAKAGIMPGLWLDRPRSGIRIAPRPTLGPRHYSYVALRNAADFLAAISFPPSLRSDTKWAVGKLGQTLMMETLTANALRALSVLRIITGLMIIQHGMAKLLGYPAVASF